MHYYRVSLGGVVTDDRSEMVAHPILRHVRAPRRWKYMTLRRVWARIVRDRAVLHGYLDSDGLPKPGLVTGRRDPESRRIMAGSAAKEALENYLVGC